MSLSSTKSQRDWFELYDIIWPDSVLIERTLCYLQPKRSLGLQTRPSKMPERNVPTLHNWNALNVQNTAKQVCCTLSGTRTANARGTITAISRLFRIPKKPLPKRNTRQKILFKFSYPKKSQSRKFQTPRSLDHPH